MRYPLDRDLTSGYRTVINFGQLGFGLYRSVRVMKQSTFFPEVIPEMWTPF